jgi:hypothetical protein
MLLDTVTFSIGVSLSAPSLAVGLLRPRTLPNPLPALAGFRSGMSSSFVSIADNQLKNYLLPIRSLKRGLGASKKEALVVVVPPSILAFQTQPYSFPLCQVPFCNNIYNATERDGWISFKQNIPPTSLKNLYIRESYKTIASSINPGINKAIITCTPGIGKSLFLIYFLWKLVKEGKRVLFIYHPYNIYYDGRGGIFQFFSGHLPLDADYSF